MSQTVSISKEEYEIFLKFKKTIENNFTIEEELSFIQNTKDAQKRVDKGEYITINSSSVNDFLNKIKQ